MHAVLHELQAHKSVLSSASHWLRPQLVASTGWAAHSTQGAAAAAAGKPAGPALLAVLIPEEQLDTALAVLELVYKGPGMQLPLDTTLLLQVGCATGKHWFCTAVARLMAEAGAVPGVQICKVAGGACLCVCRWQCWLMHGRRQSAWTCACSI
jgi:hypothetical protein